MPCERPIASLEHKDFDHFIEGSDHFGPLANGETLEARRLGRWLKINPEEEHNF